MSKTEVSNKRNVRWNDTRTFTMWMDVVDFFDFLNISRCVEVLVDVSFGILLHQWASQNEIFHLNTSKCGLVVSLSSHLSCLKPSQEHVFSVAR